MKRFHFHSLLGATEPVRSFLKALRLVRKSNDEAVTEDSSSNRAALGAAYLDEAVLFNAHDLDVLVYFESRSTKHARPKAELDYSGCVFNCCAALHLQKLLCTRNKACQKDSLSVDELFLTEILQQRSFLLSAKSNI